MTASTVKSTKVAANFDSSPRTVETAGTNGGNDLKISLDVVAVATTSLDDIGDITLGLPLKSNQRLHSLKIANTDLDSGGTSGAVKVGLHNGPDAFTDATTGTHYAAYAVISSGLFQAASTELTAANLVGTDIRFSALALTTAGKKLFELAGLATDPVRDFTVSLEVTTAMTTPVAGTVVLSATHTD